MRAPALRARPARRAPLAVLVFLDGAGADARLRSLDARRRGLRPLLGALAGEILERRAHEALGFRSIADFARERLGVGARALHDWARVWRALAELPVLRAALLAGEVSWAVVRRIVSLATPETEAACLETVRGRSVRAVDALVRAVRESEGGVGSSEAGDAGEDGERVRVALACEPRVAAKWEAALELARRMAGEALPAWECAEAIAAEAASAFGAPPAGAVARDAHRRPGPRPANEPALRGEAFPQLAWRPVPAPPDPLEALAKGLEACSPRELDRRLRAALASLQELDLERGRLLRQIQDRRLYREMGFASLEDYARERLDGSPRTARRLVRLARAEHQRPELATAFREGRITLLQAEALLRGNALLHQDRVDVAFAERVTLRRLEDETGEPAIAFHAPPEVAALFLGFVSRLGLEALLEHAIATWLEAGSQFKDYADFERDQFRCTVPACSARRNLQSHHLRFRSAGGIDEPWNRTTLCAFHHKQGVHEGSLRIFGRAPEALVFQLGVGRFRSGDVKCA